MMMVAMMMVAMMMVMVMVIIIMMSSQRLKSVTATREEGEHSN